MADTDQGSLNQGSGRQFSRSFPYLSGAAVISAIVMVGYLGISGCNKIRDSNRNQGSTPDNTPWNKKGNSVEKLKFIDFHFDLESVVRDGEQFNVADPVEPRRDEIINFVLYPTGNTHLDIDFDNKKVDPLPEEVCVPVLARDGEGRLLRNLELSPNGEDGIHTLRNGWSFGSAGVDFGIANYDENAFRLNKDLGIITIRERNFFAPKTEKDKGIDGMKNFYLVPLDGLHGRVSPEGNLTLRRDMGFYAIQRIPASEYFARTNTSGGNGNIIVNGVSLTTRSVSP